MYKAVFEYFLGQFWVNEYVGFHQIWYFRIWYLIYLKELHFTVCTKFFQVFLHLIFLGGLYSLCEVCLNCIVALVLYFETCFFYVQAKYFFVSVLYWYWFKVWPFAFETGSSFVLFLTYWGMEDITHTHTRTHTRVHAHTHKHTHTHTLWQMWINRQGRSD